METTVIFVRHCESDQRIREDAVRPLTQKGMRDTEKVTAALAGMALDAIYSSPYRRTIDTVGHLARSRSLETIPVKDFRERGVGAWVDDFRAYFHQQWADFDYCREGGESLRVVQERNVRALMDVLARHPGGTVAIGTHGTALSVIRNFFEPAFGIEGFKEMVNKMPYILIFRFRGGECTCISELELELGDVPKGGVSLHPPLSAADA